MYDLSWCRGLEFGEGVRLFLDCEGPLRFTVRQIPSAAGVRRRQDAAGGRQGRMPAHTAAQGSYVLHFQHHLSHLGNWRARGARQCLLPFIAQKMSQQFPLRRRPHVLIVRSISCKGRKRETDLFCLHECGTKITGI